MQYYIGLDIGTTTAKAVAFSPEGRVLAMEAAGYGIHHPRPGWSEQDADEIFDAVVSVLNATSRKLESAPRFISFSAAMHSLIAVNQSGDPLTPSIIWADNRAERIAEELKQTEKGKRFYKKSGVPVHAMSPLCKLLWLKENEHSVFEHAHKFLGIKEYVIFHLCGDHVVDTSLASATGLLNGLSLQWDPDILAYIGIDTRRLSAVVPVQHRLQIKTEDLPGLEGADLVIGGSDGALSNLGCGAPPHAMVVTIGTSSAARLTVHQMQLDESMRTFCYHLRNDEYVTGGAGNNGGIVLQWLKDEILRSPDDYEVLLSNAMQVPAGSEGLIFLPYILGERAPRWNAEAKGVLFGLGVHHTQSHLVRAAMEGVLFCLYSIGKVIMEKNVVNELYASGGFTQNEAWLQMLADIFGKRVVVKGMSDSSARGAVIIGAEALGLPFSSVTDASAYYEPDAHQHEVYAGQFQKFSRLYELLKEEM